jgi:hypothetical protein
MKREAARTLALVGVLLAGSHYARAAEQQPSKYNILPGVGVGDYTLGMSKDELLKRV